MIKTPPQLVKEEPQIRELPGSGLFSLQEQEAGLGHLSSAISETMKQQPLNAEPGQVKPGTAECWSMTNASK